MVRGKSITNVSLSDYRARQKIEFGGGSHSTVCVPVGAEGLRVEFDRQCSTERRHDPLTIMDGANRIVSVRSGEHRSQINRVQGSPTAQGSPTTQGSASVRGLGSPPDADLHWSQQT